MPPPPRRESPESSSSGSASVTAAAAAAADTMSGMGVGRGVHSVGSGGSGGGRSGNGVVPLGRGARRASIFDRIADVVFNEEQKEQNPVDTVAVRSVGFKSFFGCFYCMYPVTKPVQVYCTAVRISWLFCACMCVYIGKGWELADWEAGAGRRHIFRIRRPNSLYFQATSPSSDPGSYC